MSKIKLQANSGGGEAVGSSVMLDALHTALLGLQGDREKRGHSHEIELDSPCSVRRQVF